MDHSFQNSQSWKTKKTKKRGRLFCVHKETTDPIFFNFSFDKNRLKNVVAWFLENHGQYKTLQLLEKLKEYGFGYATKAGISLGIDDLKIPAKKVSMIWQAETKVAKDSLEYRNAKITGVERTQRLISTWNQTNDLLKQEVVNYFEKADLFNPIYMMAFSGARGNMSQVRQLVGMRGLMSDPQGQIIDFPIQSNFREGLTLTEYLISTYGARKGIVDTALRTATAGYLTRRLVDVAQHVLVSQFDCGTRRGIFLFDMKDANKTIYSFQNRLVGRVLAQDIFSSKEEGLTLVASRNQEIDSTSASAVAKMTKKALVRSPLTCETPRLVCQLCYGWSLSQGKLVSIGEAVGIIAAQSIGEPGTQLTMRTFHTGGVFAGGLTDQILAPFDGKISYGQTIPGSCIRTSLSEIAFITKAPGSFFLFQEQKEEKDEVYFSEIYKVPASALLFFRKNEAILKNQVVAQFSTISKKQLQYATVEQTLFSTLAGEFYFQTSLLPFSQKSESTKIQLFLEKRTEEEAVASSLELKNDILWKVKHWTNIWILSGKILFQPFESPIYLRQGDLLKKTTVFQRILWKKRQHWELFLSPSSEKLHYFDFQKKGPSFQKFEQSKINVQSNSRLLFLPEFPFFLNFHNLSTKQNEKNRKFFKNTSEIAFSSKFFSGLNFPLAFQFSKFVKKFQRSQKFVKIRKPSLPFGHNSFKKSFSKPSSQPFSLSASTPFASSKFSFVNTNQKKKSILKNSSFFSRSSPLGLEKKLFQEGTQKKKEAAQLFWKKPIFSFDFEKIRYKNFSYVFSGFSAKKNSKIFIRTLTSFNQSLGGSILQNGLVGNLATEKSLTTENFYGADTPKFFSSCFFENFQTSSNGIFSLISFENLSKRKKLVSFVGNTSTDLSLKALKFLPFSLFSKQFLGGSIFQNSLVGNLSTAKTQPSSLGLMSTKKRTWKFEGKNPEIFNFLDLPKKMSMNLAFFEKEFRNFPEKTELYTSEISWIPQETYSFQTVISKSFSPELKFSSFFVGKKMHMLEVSNKQGRRKKISSNFESLAQCSILPSSQIFLEQKYSIRKSSEKLNLKNVQNSLNRSEQSSKTFQFLKFKSLFASSKKRKSFAMKNLEKKVSSNRFSPGKGFQLQRKPLKKQFSTVFEKNNTNLERKIQKFFGKKSIRRNFAFPFSFKTAKSKCFTCLPLFKTKDPSPEQCFRTSKKNSFQKIAVQVKLQPGWICFFPKTFSVFDFHQTLHQKGHLGRGNFCFEQTKTFSEAFVLERNASSFLHLSFKKTNFQETERTFCPQIVVKKESSPFLSFSERKNRESFQNLLEKVSVFEKLQVSGFSKKNFSYEPQLSQNSLEKTKICGILFSPMHSKSLENPKTDKTFEEIFQAGNIQNLLNFKTSSVKLVKKYHSPELNLQIPKKTLFLKTVTDDFVLCSGFPQMYFHSLSQKQKNLLPKLKKEELIFAKKKAMVLRQEVHQNFQELLSRQDLLSNSQRKSPLFVQKSFQRKQRKKVSFSDFFLKHMEKNSFFSYYPLQLLPMFSLKGSDSFKENSVCFGWDPFQSKATFSELSKKSAFFEQRLPKIKTRKTVVSSFWSSRTEKNFVFENTSVKNVQGRKSKAIFSENSLYLKNTSYSGNTKIFTPFDGEILSMYTNETNWWKKAAEISTLQRFSNFFSIVTKKDLFRLSFFENHTEPFRNNEENSEILFHEKQKHLISLYGFVKNQTKGFRENFDQSTILPSPASISSMFKYQKKIYTFKNLRIGSPLLKKDPELGKLYVYGDCFFQRAIPKPGQFLHMSSSSGTFRKGQPFLVSPNGFLHFSNTPYIQKNRPILTLPYQTVQSGDIVQGIPKVEQLFEARTTVNGRLFLTSFPILLKGIFHRYQSFLPLDQAVRQSFLKIQQLLIDGVQRVYRSQGVSIVDKHVEIIVRQMTTKVQILHGAQTGFFPGELVNFAFLEKINKLFLVKIRYEPVLLGITRASLEVDSFLSASSFQQTTKILALASISRKKDFLKGLKENILVGNLIPSGTGYVVLRKDL